MTHHHNPSSTAQAPNSSAFKRSVLSAHIALACAFLAACGGGGSGQVDTTSPANSVGGNSQLDDERGSAAADAAGDVIGKEILLDPLMETLVESIATLPEGEAASSITVGASESAAPVTESADSEAEAVAVDEHSFASRITGAESVGIDSEMHASSLGSSVNCSKPPVVPAPPANAKKVTTFGAIPDDGKDDSVAIQAAMDSLKGGEWLVFPPGKYTHNKYLRLKVAGTTLYGKGATLHATNPDSVALMMSADNTAVYMFKLTAVTNTRKSAAQHARISVFKDDHSGVRVTARNITIQGNSIVNAGNPGTPEANSASSAGILISDTDGFLIAQNTVARSLADGIHITGGSRNGRVVNNTVRETGDDMIAVVSYAQGGNAVLNTAAGLRDVIASGKSLNKNIMLVGNKVSSNYWGRGITVAGVDGVTVRDNYVKGVPAYAGILVIRDHNYKTFGVNNAIVEGNWVSNIQNTTPPYNPGNKFNGTRSDHGAVEIESFLFADEAADPVIREAFSVKNVSVRYNNMTNSYPGGVRSGVYSAGTLSAVDPKTGQKVYRSYSVGEVKNIGFHRNTMNAVRYAFSLQTPGTLTATAGCTANTFNGAAASHSACVASPPPVTGGVVSCSVDGRPNSL